QWVFVLAFCVALGAALVAAIGVYAIRRVLRQDLVDSAAAQTVINVAKLHALSERTGGHARGFLLTAEPRSLERVASDRRAFFTALETLSLSVEPEDRGRLESVGRAARAYDEALDGVIGLRRADQPADAVARAFEEQGR